MSEQTTPPLSPDTQAMLDCLCQAVSVFDEFGAVYDGNFNREGRVCITIRL